MMKNPLWILVVLLVASLGSSGEIVRVDTAQLIYFPGQSCRPPQQSQPAGRTLETCRFLDEAESLGMTGGSNTGILERILTGHLRSNIHQQARRMPLGETATGEPLSFFDQSLAWLGVVCGLIFLGLAGRLGYSLLKARHKPGDIIWLRSIKS